MDGGIFRMPLLRKGERRFALARPSTSRRLVGQQLDPAAAFTLNHPLGVGAAATSPYGAEGPQPPLTLIRF